MITTGTAIKPGVISFRRGQTYQVSVETRFAPDADLVQSQLDAVCARWPLPWAVDVFLVSYASSVPGQSAISWCGEASGAVATAGRYKDIAIGNIALFGSYAPPHPALVRANVAHEYGHLVEAMLAARLHNGSGRALLTEYATLRGLTLAPNDALNPLPGVGWTRHPGEVFANDFRLLLAQVEEEHWPHPGIARPETRPDVIAWWQRACEIVV